MGFLSKVNRFFYGYSFSPFMLLCLVFSMATVHPLYGLWAHLAFCALSGAVGAILEGKFR